MRTWPHVLHSIEMIACREMRLGLLRRAADHFASSLSALAKLTTVGIPRDCGEEEVRLP